MNKPISHVITSALLLCIICVASFAEVKNETSVDRQFVLKLLRGPADMARNTGFTAGEKRRQIDPYLMGILMSYANTNCEQALFSSLNKDTFEPLLQWLSSPPNAEALIGINEILHQPYTNWLRSCSLSFLDRLDAKKKLVFPVQGGDKRLREYYLSTTPAVPLVEQLMAKALAQNGDSTGKALLLSTLKDNAASKYRHIECARALLFIDAECEEALAFVSNHLNDGTVSDYEKTKTMEVLYDVGHSSGQQWVNELLSSTNANQALYVSLLLLQRSDPRGISYAIHLARKPDPVISGRARGLLRMFVPDVKQDELEPARLKWNAERNSFELRSL